MQDFPPFFFMIAAVAAGSGLLMVSMLFRKIKALPAGDAGPAKIARAIAQGAMTFLREEYKIIAAVGLVVACALGYIFGLVAAFVFIAGALLSACTGYIGMRAATLANVRTTIAAKEGGEHAAFLVAFFGGGVMGFSVATFGLIGLTTVYYFFVNHPQFVAILTSFGLGGSLVAFFARVGGGIYTKSADVGADLVGKVEAGIPEDDPRNPAVIADNVGDCVGDTAGMGADIYESYVGAMVSAIILAVAHPTYHLWPYKTLPIILASLGLLSSIFGLFANLFVQLDPAAMLRNATFVSIGIFLALSGLYLKWLHLDMHLFTSILLGCGAGIIIGLITEYYTGSTPVRKLADISRSGAATNLIYGLSVGMESTAAPVVVLVIGVLLSYNYGGGLYGVALAAVSMLATVGITMTVDAYGPIADNAGGIAEMSHFGSSVRSVTDKLDALGNTTAAMGKGFAIGSALLTALALFSAYSEQAQLLAINVINPLVLAGLFVGGVMPFVISAFTMRSVGGAALKMVMEVRRQFKEIPGLMQGNAEPDYKQCVAISTQAALREMILPGVLTVALPIVIHVTLGAAAVGGMLVGSTLVGVLLALMMANSGGAWDNAKKYIESGHLGGKGSDAHKSAVIGDTVGDPFKDTSGPALNILIKLMSIVALLLVS